MITGSQTDQAAAQATVQKKETIIQLTEIWQRLLGANPIEPDQNYFDLGGDSSLAVQLFAEIERVFKVKLPLATLFEAQTVGELSAVICRQSADVQTAVTTPQQGSALKPLTEIWQRLLGVAHVEPDQNYFDLGGDSSLAVQLFAEIENVFKIKLPLATLFEAQTVAELAEVLARHAPASVPGWSSLVAIRSEGSRPPFFCFHGAGGEVLIYRDLALNLWPDQPFYGLQAVGLDGSRPPLTTIEDMAATYARDIQAMQPHGPYFVGGYCAGGTIAYEVAQQLLAKGESMGLVALFDTSNWSKIAIPGFLAKVYHGAQKIVFHAANVLSLDYQGMKKFLGEKVQLLRKRVPVWRGMLQARFSKTSGEGSAARVLGQIWRNTDQACIDYLPKPYPGKITDFRPKKQYRMFNQADAKWDELALGGQDVVVLPVYPAGMLIEPFVKHLADGLRTAMDEAIRSGGTGKAAVHASIAR